MVVTKNKICVRATVSGKVQGVFFRDSTQKKARELQLTGWVKNIPNGDVELVACGERHSIMVLIEWLWDGPPAASVDNVRWEKITWENHVNFNVRRLT